MTSKAVSPAPDELTGAKSKPDLVTVPEHTVVALDGAGSPDDPNFAEAIGALYGVAYGLRFTRKAAGQPVFKVGPLVGAWTAEGPDLPEDRVPDRQTWRWQVMIPLPDDVTEQELADIVEAVTTKKGGKLEGSATARRCALIRRPAARYARILHKGPYATEPESFDRIQELLDAEGLSRDRAHIEVYLSIPGRTSEDKLKTGLLTRIVE